MMLMQKEAVSCNLCPRNCNALRFEESGKGFCKMGMLPVIARAAPHYWEEPCISDSRGSGTVFFSGCTLRCAFCQNYSISAMGKGKQISVKRLAEIYRELEGFGVHNINLVNPTHFIPAILESFQIYRPKIPIVYNCSGYEKAETLKMLEGVVDIYLPDFKYADSVKAMKYSSAPDYFKFASEAVSEMARQTGKAVFDEEGILQKGTVVRHLILPENTNDSIRILDWLDKNLSDTVLVSLMGQYLPCGEAGRFPELTRKITSREYHKVEDFLCTLHLDGFVQKLSSAQKEFIPSFDFEGVERPFLQQK